MSLAPLMPRCAATVLLVAGVAISTGRSGAFAVGSPPTSTGTCCFGGGNGSGAAAGRTEVVAWVASATGGGLRPPKGTSSCSPWVRDTENVLGAGPPGPNGVAMNLFVRVCDGVAQGAWVPVMSPADLAQLAFEQVRRLVTPPAVTVSPPAAVGGLVNVPAWLAVQPAPAINATAGPLPTGLATTATATVRQIRWTPGDGTPARACSPWGELPEPQAPLLEPGPCSWTPSAPSAPQFAGGTDGRFHGSVELVWSVTWVSTDGVSGSLGDLVTAAPLLYRVREMQTIGVDR